MNYLRVIRKSSLFILCIIGVSYQNCSKIHLNSTSDSKPTNVVQPQVPVGTTSCTPVNDPTALVESWVLADTLAKSDGKLILASNNAQVTSGFTNVVWTLDINRTGGNPKNVQAHLSDYDNQYSIQLPTIVDASLVNGSIQDGYYSSDMTSLPKSLGPCVKITATWVDNCGQSHQSFYNTPASYSSYTQCAGRALASVPPVQATFNGIPISLTRRTVGHISDRSAGDGNARVRNSWPLLNWSDVFEANYPHMMAGIPRIVDLNDHEFISLEFQTTSLFPLILIQANNSFGMTFNATVSTQPGAFGSYDYVSKSNGQLCQVNGISTTHFGSFCNLEPNKTYYLNISQISPIDGTDDCDPSYETCQIAFTNYY